MSAPAAPPVPAPPPLPNPSADVPKTGAVKLMQSRTSTARRGKGALTIPASGLGSTSTGVGY